MTRLRRGYLKIQMVGCIDIELSLGPYICKYWQGTKRENHTVSFNIP